MTPISTTPLVPSGRGIQLDEERGLKYTPKDPEVGGELTSTVALALPFFA